MPQYICKNCIEHLHDCYKFYTTCQKSQEILKSTLNCNTRKDADIIYSFPLTEEEEKITCDNVSEELIFTSTTVDDETECNESTSSRRERKTEQSNYEHCNINTLDGNLTKKNVRMKRRNDLKNAPQTAAVQFPCTFCGEVFESRSKLLHHRKKVKHQRSKINTCSKCGKIFVSNSKLIQHMRVHTKERPFKCDVCQQSFSTNGNLNRHLKTHTGERQFICEKCGKGKTSLF